METVCEGERERRRGGERERGVASGDVLHLLKLILVLVVNVHLVFVRVRDRSRSRSSRSSNGVSGPGSRRSSLLRVASQARLSPISISSAAIRDSCAARRSRTDRRTTNQQPKLARHLAPQRLRLDF